MESISIVGVPAQPKCTRAQALHRLEIPPREAFDAIITLDKGIIYNIKDQREGIMIRVGKERKTGIVGCSHNKDNLMNFLVYLSHIIPWEMRAHYSAVFGGV